MREIAMRLVRKNPAPCGILRDIFRTHSRINLACGISGHLSVSIRVYPWLNFRLCGWAGKATNG
jgi:hypothetical protein